MSGFVVDASVAAKWVIPELHSDRAQALLSQRGLTAPAHWHAEAVNAAWAMVARGDWTAEQGMLAASVLIEAPVHSVALRPHLRRALELSARLGCTVYDALYVAVAEAVGAPLVTDDRKLVRKMRLAGLGAAALPIAEFPLR